MNVEQQQDLLAMLKAIADQQRLTMVGLMSVSERTVTEMAELLKLSEPTISHHVSKLHGLELLNLRMAGNQRFYRINEKRLAQFKAYVDEIEKLPIEPEVEVSDNGWIDALDWDEADKKVLRDHTFNGQIPQKLRIDDIEEKNWLVILRWLTTRFEPGTRYTEKQVNANLSEIHQDYATMRRSLVEYGFMRRERGGGDYWLTPDNERTE